MLLADTRFLAGCGVLLAFAITTLDLPQQNQDLFRLVG
jgi:hypothetical protein